MFNWDFAPGSRFVLYYSFLWGWMSILKPSHFCPWLSFSIIFLKDTVFPWIFSIFLDEYSTRIWFKINPLGITLSTIPFPTFYHFRETGSHFSSSWLDPQDIAKSNPSSPFIRGYPVCTDGDSHGGLSLNITQVLCSPSFRPNVFTFSFLFAA